MTRQGTDKLVGRQDKTRPTNQPNNQPTNQPTNRPPIELFIIKAASDKQLVKVAQQNV